MPSTRSTMMMMTKLTEWFSNGYWYWRDVAYFRFGFYQDDIDRGAFFEELNSGWLEMYCPDTFADEPDYAQFLRNLDDYDDWEVGLEPIPQDTTWTKA